MIGFLGNYVPDEDYNWFVKHSNSGVPFSSTTHQKSIINGLMAYEMTSVIYISPTGFFPTRFNRVFVSPKRINDQITRLRSCNIPVLRLFFNSRTEVRGMEDLIKKGVTTMVCYMPFYHRMKAIQDIKKKYPELTIIVIVPDLVEHSYSDKGPKIRQLVVKTIRRKEAKIIDKMSKSVDGFVYLAEKMHEKFGAEKPYIVQEAIYEMRDATGIQDKEKQSKHFVFTYCGKIDKFNGIDVLLQAFSMINSDKVKLYLCGTGEMVDIVKQAAEKDERICYLGQLSHEETVSLERGSTVLVNPRYTTIENAAYSFPSKLIEYLACGRPVITTKLAGIPEDYYEHLIFVNNDSAKDLSAAMERVMRYSEKELDAIGRENEQFVRKNKSAKAQGKKLIEFIKKVEDNA